MQKSFRTILFFLGLGLSLNAISETQNNFATNNMTPFVADADSALNIEPSRYSCWNIDCPDQCRRARGCSWSYRADRCVRKRFDYNRYCSRIDCPKTCERTRGCDWRRRRGCVSKRW